MSVSRGEYLTLIMAVLAVLLAGCALSQPDPTKVNSAVFPPAPALPTATLSLISQPTATEPVNRLSNAPMPTAIIRMIGEAFPSPEAMATPLPTATVTPCNTPGQIVTGTYQSVAAGLSNYRIYLPPCYESEGHTYPTLYMLPGNIHSDSVWDRLGLDEAAEAAINLGDIPPLIIVMANGGALANNTSGGPWSYESVILDDLIPFIESSYCAWRDSEGRAIGGMSRGGYWALEIAFRHPDQFTSVGGHSAALLDLYGGPDVIPQSTGLANDLGDLRIYFDIGANDWVINNIRQLHEDMETAGKAHIWVLNEGRHEDAYWANHTDDYIAWYSEPWPMQRDAYPLCMNKTKSKSH